MTSVEPTAGPVPEENQPGHHPPVEQDKPHRAPSLPPRHRRFAFKRSFPIGLTSIPFGAIGDRAYVEIDDHDLRIRFGPWAIDTTLDNVEGAQETGPYQWWKVIGPPRLSLADVGITFATTTDSGVCIRFREPVPGALPNEWVRHPGATVTVEDADELVRLLNQ